MKARYLLLNPLKADDFGISTEEMIEAVHEFGCKVITSLNTKGQTMVYAVADNKATIENMVNTVEIDGSIVEYTAIYDQFIEE
jgi:hypothetical protein